MLDIISKNFVADPQNDARQSFQNSQNSAGAREWHPFTSEAQLWEMSLTGASHQELARQAGESALFAFSNRFLRRRKKTSSLDEVNVCWFLIPQYVQNISKHRGRQVHSDDPAALGIIFKAHPRIVEPDESSGVSIRPV